MESKPGLDNISETAKEVIVNPAEFYRTMPKTGGYGDPIIFLVAMALISGFIVALFAMLGAGMAAGMVTALSALIVLPILAVIASFIGAAVLFLIWRLMGSSESYETAYRCAAYASAISPITVIVGSLPLFGTLVGLLWGAYLMVMASVEVHGIKAKPAYIVFGVLAAIMVLLNLGSMTAARNVAGQVENMGSRVESTNERIESGEMTPEQAGEAFGELLRGMEAGAPGSEQ